MRIRPLQLALLTPFAIAVVLAGGQAVEAFSASSSNYRIDDAVLNSIGGDASSTEYQLTASGGEAFIGAGSSTNYKFNAGFVAQLEQSISLSLDSLTKTIPALTPGTSQNATTTVTVYTDAAGYNLSARQNRDLTHTDGTTTISGVPGTIAVPALWTEGTTKGFGITLTAGTGLDAKWGTSPNFKYGALTNSNQVIHAKANYVNANDTTTVQYRLDVPDTQIPGTYSNQVTYSATVKP